MTPRADTARSAGAQAGPGRPRAYDEAEVLMAALEVFRRQGFEATSLDDLTGAMGISRSSLYAAFGSKQDVLLAALRTYSAKALAALRDIAAADRAGAVPAMLTALANPSGGPHGCLLVNCITELAPQNEEVADLGRRHLEAIERMVADSLGPDGSPVALDRARALTALAIGTLTLRKSGLPAGQIEAALVQGIAALVPPSPRSS
ncbi:TetR family transcriptional regulator [Microvirga tunisiensis]|uniref:TetR family transcriptional regulator n=1 Tax=Pannonibacter tanglangensis TaxID=2750084 RepID=A0A7X5F1V4_9HYPH|nr:TetR/AcrR family transcriptional regulator [Pannonibacter sp. XCT-53]NBN78251.1 TetR family transcriptional regulator [Pannonibacter sp. XCT-53]